MVLFVFGVMFGLCCFGCCLDWVCCAYFGYCDFVCGGDVVACGLRGLFNSVEFVVCIGVYVLVCCYSLFDCA